MPPELRRELIRGLELAAQPGAFRPRFYRVRVSKRRERRYRRPGMASPLTVDEMRALQAFRYFEGCSINELSIRFKRSWRTVRKALSDPAFIAATSEAR
jgi:hypothetical protein